MMAVSFQQSHELAQAVDSVNRFGIAIYRELAAQQPGQSFFFSPSSIAFALAMTLQGAAGETADELAQALCGDCQPEAFHRAMAALFESTNNSSVELRLANRLWGQAGYEFLPAFLEATERYGARLAELDFKNDAEAARATINSWVSEQTRGKINEAIPTGTVTKDTRSIVTNTAYFLGTWFHEFSETATVDEQFWVNGSDAQLIPLMSQQAHYGYVEHATLKVLEMSYLENLRDFIDPPSRASDATISADVVMSVLLPNEREGLPAIESQVTSEQLRDWLSTDSNLVAVSLPRFRVRSGMSLEKMLGKLGIRRAFDATRANFSNATQHPEGFVLGKVLHRAFVSVDEKGTEAAAATVAFLFAGAARFEKPKVFRADHPFLFLIRDRTTKLIHFMGRFTGS